MILGTSKVLSKSGPVDLLTITKMLKKMQEKIWNHPGKYYLCKSWTHEISKKMMSHIDKSNIFQDDSIFFLVFFEAFW